MNHDIDEFDIDEFDESDWESDLESIPETIESPLSVKKSSSLIPIISILGICGLAVLGYMHFNTSSFTSNIPVVTLDKQNPVKNKSPLNVSSEDILEIKHNSVEEHTNKTEFINTNTPDIDSSLQANVTKDTALDVLTPFPDQEPNIELDLPDLNLAEIDQELDEISTIDTNTHIIDEHIETETLPPEDAAHLEENILLEKTELNFEAPLINETPSQNATLNGTQADTPNNNTNEVAEPLEQNNSTEQKTEETISLKQENHKEESDAIVIENKPVAKPKPKNTKKTYAQPKPKWSIRAAKKGHAVIVDQHTGNNLSIEIGSTVKGIGRIKSIKNIEGKWVISGTNGKITQ